MFPCIIASNVSLTETKNDRQYNTVEYQDIEADESCGKPNEKNVRIHVNEWTRIETGQQRRQVLQVTVKRKDMEI